MEERRRGFIDIDQRLSNLEVNSKERLVRLEVSMEKLEEDLKDIKKILDKLSDKLNLAESEIWVDLDVKEKSFNQRLADLEREKMKNRSIFAVIGLAAGSLGNTVIEKLIKFLS
jgi:predicted nuclease with TOPRIM domain